MVVESDSETIVDLVKDTKFQVLCFNLRPPLKLFLFILKIVKTFIFSLALELVFSLV